MANPVPDAELVRRFKEGDRSAFGEIVHRYRDRVYTMCVRWMGDRVVAEEVAQDVFLALFRSLANFRGDAQLSTWIYRVVVNHCKNRRLYRRRRHLDHQEPLEGDREDDGPGRQIADEGPGTDASVHASQASTLVEQGLAALSEEQRYIIVLREMQDLSYEEIADLLDLPRGTVKSRLHRARCELAQVLARKITREDVT
ncbi:MAG: sigma-70 family RNA polymerase sigma factor [Myxococcota bacterium]